MATTENSFIDETQMRVVSGNGGDGRVSFRREKYVPRGGPNGGDGGCGGSVILVADANQSTLLKIARQHNFKAEHGFPGLGNNCAGRNGKDIRINVPVGTIVRDADSGFVLRDLKQIGEEVIVAKGGHGGRGNKKFASSINQTPREFEPGRRGENRLLQLELKLMADVGLIGLPNAGKSTLISILSAAKPKVASYPFTTLTPCLGIVEMYADDFIVMADIPGLIEGAHEGAGLGFQFLRHVERCRILVHLVDIAPIEERDPVEAYHVIRTELERYNPALASKQEILVANKVDLIDNLDAVNDFAEKVGKPVLSLSGISGQGKKELFKAIASALQEADEQDADEYA